MEITRYNAYMDLRIGLQGEIAQLGNRFILRRERLLRPRSDLER